ncbi:MAG: PEP/pyruvate-binding domain-containing protein [Candidatus Helarchaeota archaeon]
MTKIKLLYNLGELGKGAIHAIGGKAAHLGELIKRSIPIPRGFVLSTSAFERFINRSPYRQEIREILDREIELRDLLSTSQKLEKYILETSLPPDIKDPIVHRFMEFHADNPHSIEVAVRSSANVEDLSETSFAGQADTFLCINNPDDLLLAIKRCWASLYSARSLMYIQQMVKVPLNLVNMGVIIQRMVNAEVAGVMFTANVLTKDHGQTLINATWGFGETIADGQVEPDLILVDNTSLEILKVRIGSKLKMSVRDPSTCGTCLQETLPEKRESLCLSEDQIRELVQIGQRIEKFFQGQPQDIEWAFEQGQLRILQSRDITTI